MDSEISEIVRAEADNGEGMTAILLQFLGESYVEIARIAMLGWAADNTMEQAIFDLCFIGEQCAKAERMKSAKLRAAELQAEG